MSSDETLAQVADEAFESVKQLARSTLNRALPAPLVYGVLGNLKYAGGHNIAEVLERLARGLDRSLVEFEVYDKERSPEESVAMAIALLNDAQQHAAKVGELLERAQSAISMQGYKP